MPKMDSGITYFLAARGWRVIIASVCFLLLLTACSRPTTLEKILQENTLHIVIKNAPGIYYQGREGPEGFEYELARLFAEELGVELRLRVVNSNLDIERILTNGHTHFATAGLILTPPRKLQFMTSRPLLDTKQLVVYRVGSGKPQTISDLIGKQIGVIADSHQEALLQSLTLNHPDLSFQRFEEIEAVELLKKVEEQSLDYAVVDAVEQNIYQAYFPRAQAAFALTQEEHYGWVFSASEDGSLAARTNAFLDKIAENGTLAEIRERYYGHIDQLNYVDARTYKHHIEKRLPKYRNAFESAASLTDLDWALLAAIGYQESHWRAKAKSPTGVRGLMMLTRVTAKEMGISNRLDALQSIEGGAKYFRKTKDRIPDRIAEPDRTWLALAAYNVGLGHLEDARIITEKLGKNPDKWIDVKDSLPLLQQRKWYSQTRYGYARGYEPVLYVQNIRRYFDVLVWTLEDEARQVEAIALESERSQPNQIPEHTAELKLAIPINEFPPTL